MSDESYLGFLVRLADINGYDTPRWILKESNLSSDADFPCVLLTHQKPNYERLASLTGLTVEQLGALTYQAADKHHVNIFSYQVRPFLLRPQWPRICVACIRESAYCRKQWDFSAVTACPLHRVMLLERCPKCKRPITWFRSRVSHCPCGADWIGVKTKELPESECVVSRLIYEAFELIPKRQDQRHNNLLHNVDLHSLVTALSLMISLREGPTDTTGKFVFPKRPTSEIHRKLFRAYCVFDSWPIDFRKFIDELSVGTKLPKSRTNPLPGAVGRLYQRLHDQKYLPAGIRKVLCHEFENYIIDAWNPRYLVMSPRFKTKLDNAYMSRLEAARTLKLDCMVIDALVSERTLGAFTKRSGNKTMLFIEKASVEEFRMNCGQYLSLNDASRLLGVSYINTMRLIENSLLTRVRGRSANDRSAWRFEEQTVKQFIASIVGRVAPLPFAQDKPSTFNNVLLALTTKLSSMDWGIHTFVRDILEGLITPRGQTAGKPGVSALIFFRREVDEYVRVKLSNRGGRKIAVTTAARDLKISPAAVHFLVAKGLIETTHGEQRGSLCRVVSPEAVRQFKRDYVTARSIAVEIGTTIYFLVKTLMLNGIYPVSGKSIDGGPQYILRSPDLAPLNLRRLLRAAPIWRKDKRRSSPTVSVKEAADILRVHPRVIDDLVRNGVLKPCARPFASKSQNRFNRTTVERRKLQFDDLTDLISVEAAAELFQIKRQEFFLTWVKGGGLSFQRPKVGKRAFLRKSEVEQLLAFRDSVATATQAYALFGISWPRLKSLRETGLLKPVPNPFPRGFRSFIYSRSDLARFDRS
ncbi:MAG: TniQ family protein [Pyrinomonadaceae bacterium]